MKKLQLKCVQWGPIWILYGSAEKKKCYFLPLCNSTSSHTRVASSLWQKQPNSRYKLFQKTRDLTVQTSKILRHNGSQRTGNQLSDQWNKLDGKTVLKHAPYFLQLLQTFIYYCSFIDIDTTLTCSQNSRTSSLHWFNTTAENLPFRFCSTLTWSHHAVGADWSAARSCPLLAHACQIQDWWIERSLNTELLSCFWTQSERYRVR